MKANNGSSAATVGFEHKLWAAADTPRNNMGAAEYKHVVLGLIFLKYISDAFSCNKSLQAGSPYRHRLWLVTTAIFVAQA